MAPEDGLDKFAGSKFERPQGARRVRAMDGPHNPDQVGGEYSAGKKRPATRRAFFYLAPEDGLEPPTR